MNVDAAFLVAPLLDILTVSGGPKLVLTMPLSNCSIPLYQASQRCDDARVCYLSNCLIIRYINHRKPMEFVQL